MMVEVMVADANKLTNKQTSVAGTGTEVAKSRALFDVVVDGEREQTKAMV